MNYIINLSRFVSINEKKNIMIELEKQGISARQDPWSSLRLITDKPIFNKPYISNIIELKETFFPKTISEIIEHLNKCEVKNITAKIWDNVPFHKKAIVDRYLKKYKFNETGVHIYLEAKPRANSLAPEVRLGVFLESKTSSISEHQKSTYPDLLIESPKTIGEISDFVRLSKTFKIKVYISTLNDPDCIKAISEFKSFNSFNKANIEIINFSDALRQNYVFIGFSMWGVDNISSVSSLAKGDKKLLLLFGNEKRGLKKNTMDMCEKVIKIGNNSSEPLRATQAAAFALGYLQSVC